MESHVMFCKVVFLQRHTLELHSKNSIAAFSFSILFLFYFFNLKSSLYRPYCLKWMPELNRASLVYMTSFFFLTF